MSRFLFVAPPLVGHVNPLTGVARELVARGHRVAWAGHGELLGALVREPVFPCAVPEDAPAERPAGLTGPSAFQFLWRDFFVPLADAMAPGVADAVDAFEPDVVVSDQHAVAGSLVAERRGVPCVGSASTSAELVDPLASMPKVAAWVDGLLAALRERHGNPVARNDPRYPEHGVLAFTTAALAGSVDRPGLHLVGPALGKPRPGVGFPWAELDGRPVVLVSLGTANTGVGGRFLRAAAEAFADRPGLRAVVVDPGGELGAVPDNVLVRQRVPQLELLPRCAAVVCHSGHNTVCEALWHGVPLVLAPIRDDQPIVAGQVVDAGAGLRLRFNRAGAEAIGKAVDAVLDPAGGHRDAARAIGDSFRAAGGASAAADHLIAVAR
ncbi:glycosyltransferase [Actinosynnema pretiosum]|uniref:Glycosyl transferase n=1 Tax=Actinosynnema pretiosum TaxID=42197 RepID=A0A290Z4T7_9PSEU|nr:glycosyltransferase [Actinosynnema pretiosum]ATE54040.1 glycosyl transferase [Actinosynnema pretiosum]